MDESQDKIAPLPTGHEVKKATGLPYDYLKLAFECARNTLMKRLGDLPKELKEEQDIKIILDLYDFAITDYMQNKPSLGSETKKQWELLRPKYEAALREELVETQEDAEFLKKYGPILTKYAVDNTNHLKPQIKRLFKELKPEQAMKLAYFYEGYAGLFNTPCCKADLILACIAIMTDEGKGMVKSKIGSMTRIVESIGPWIIFNGPALTKWWEIKYRKITDLRKSVESTWDVFNRKFGESEYDTVLGMTVLLLFFNEFQLSDDDLEIVRDCAFFLTGEQQTEVFEVARSILTDRYIQAPYSLENIDPLLELATMENTHLRLEHYLGLECEDELGIYQLDANKPIGNILNKISG